MKYIDCTQKEVVYNRIKRIPVEEITSYEQLNELPIGTEVTIMHNMSMNIGKIDSKHDGWISIWDNVNCIAVKPNSFQYRNFLYKIL
jgi:hypothetical protein